MRILRSLYVGVALGFLCAPLAAQQETAAPEPSAAELYAMYCAQCHGANLQGGSAPSLVDGVWLYGDRDSYIARNIKHGITHMGMPAYEKRLTNDQIGYLASRSSDELTRDRISPCRSPSSRASTSAWS